MQNKIHFRNKDSTNAKFKTELDYAIDTTCIFCDSKKVVEYFEDYYYYYNRCKYCNRIWKSPKEKKEKNVESKNLKSNKSEVNFSYNSKELLLFVCIVLLFLLLFYYYFCNSSSELTDRELVEKMKKKYPLQNNETWYKILGVLERSPPSVKSIVLLHGEDKTTANCLVEELVRLFSKEKIMDISKISFSNMWSETEDYGLALEYFIPVVSRYKMIVTDLSEVSGKIARIFHSLCDEVSFNVKPSLFIFTLRYDESPTLLKPIDMASKILKESWKDLKTHELMPLLSRIVRTVFYVVPENDIKC